MIVRQHRAFDLWFRVDGLARPARSEGGHVSIGGGGAEGEVAVVAFVQGFDEVVAGAAKRGRNLVVGDAGLRAMSIARPAK